MVVLNSTLAAFSCGIFPDVIQDAIVSSFESLIEREWICAGHPFSLRCAHSAYATGGITGPHESPVFLCFLDCVWQVQHFIAPFILNCSSFSSVVSNIGNFLNFILWETLIDPLFYTVPPL